MCTICSNINVIDIDKEIIRGAKLNSISKKYDLGYSAVQRHASKCLNSHHDDKIDINELLKECLEISLGSASVQKTRLFC